MQINYHPLYRTVYICKSAWAWNNVTNVKVGQWVRREGAQLCSGLVGNICNVKTPLIPFYRDSTMAPQRRLASYPLLLIYTELSRAGF